jgi:DNA invertase Pin-like site-specific DNA recombinase
MRIEGTVIYGYVRVSTAQQAREGTSLASQRKLLTDAGAERLFEDAGQSGVKKNRPALDDLLDHLRRDDTVVVTKLDRLGRSLSHLVSLIEDFSGKGITFKSLSEGIDSSTSAGRLMIGVFGALAEFERDRIEERTSVGRAAARAKGRLGGRPRSYDAAMVMKARKIHGNTDLTSKEKAAALGVSVATYYRLLQKEDDEGHALEV